MVYWLENSCDCACPSELGAENISRTLGRLFVSDYSTGNSYGVASKMATPIVCYTISPKRGCQSA